MKKNLQNKTAFSLIELSIVILIIGVIVAGVTQSSRMISAFRLSTARNITQSSPLASMRNLVLWFETTSEKSFLDSESDNSLSVTTWYDINPTSNYKYTSTQSTGTSKATYTTNCMNSLPCLRFDGGDNYSFDGSFLVGTDYTVIVVEQRRTTSQAFFINGSDNSTNNRLHIGYRTNTSLTFAQYANDYDITVSAYVTVIPRIDIARFSSSTGKNFYINGVNQTLNDTGGAVATQGLTSNNGANIGSNYVGDICEVIIFNRAITTEERDAIEVYLGKKWKIVVS